MKKTFVAPEMTILFVQEDIVTTSPALDVLNEDQLSHWHRLR